MEMIEFENFNHAMALQFVRRAIRIIEKENLKPVRIRVRYEGDIVAQFLMEGKKGEEWLDRKEKTVLATGLPSIEVWKNPENWPLITEENGYAVCGGGYPIIINGAVKGAWVISGLAHDEDHALIVRILEEMKKENKNNDEQ